MGNIRIAAKLVAFGAHVDNIRKDILLEISNAAKADEQSMRDISLKNEENEGEVDDMEKKCQEQEESNKEEATASHANVPEEEHTHKLNVKTQLEADMKPPDMELNVSKINLSEDENVQIQSSECEQLEKEMRLLTEDLQLMRSTYESQTEEIGKLTHKLYSIKLQTKKYKEISKVSAASETLHTGKCQQLEEENKFLKEQLQSLQSKKDSLAQENTKLKEDQKHLTESCKYTIAMTEQYKIFLTQKSEREISEQVEKVSTFIQEQTRARAYQDAVWTSTVQAQQSKISQLSNKLLEYERKIKRLEDENCKLHLRVHLCQTSSETFTTRNSLNNPTERNTQSFLGPQTHFSAREDYAVLSPRLRSAFEKVDAFLREL